MKRVVAVGMSGGVDSSVAVHLLNKEFDVVVGVSHYIWPDSACCNISVLNMARHICENASIPYFVIDMVDQFKKAVVDDFSATYLSGKTPNPCVRCNERIRFTDFFSRIHEKLSQEGILNSTDELFFATGHYVQLHKDEDGLFLAKGRDSKKDQSYMLYKIPKTHLQHLVFPLGTMYKSDVIQIAKEMRLPSANLKESQDVCFVDTDYIDFIAKYKNMDLNIAGEIYDVHGNFLGKSRGYIHYTIGQRKGLGLGNGPWFVVEIKPEENIVIVGKEEDTKQTKFYVNEPNWFLSANELPQHCDVKVRYNSASKACHFQYDSKKVLVELKEPATISPGQSAVFYKGDIVLGGGIISYQ